MDRQTAYLLAAFAMLGACAACCAAEWLVKWLARKAKFVAARRANDCKPGCFMTNSNEDLH